MFRHVSRHRVRYALIAVLLAFVVITVVKTRQGDWFSFR
jgi:Flp pilus assembly pilin Flp